ncbi:MAG: retroviral-like aspartic protease family protein [Phenylobacterium sp.]|nr:retroviral-like aspartic protease family protein [Phenylobacterium sp.]
MTPSRPSGVDRRRAAAMLAAGAVVTGCAVVRPARPVLVNLAEPSAVEGDQAQLGAGADLARRMTVPVRVDGQGPYPFVVDTGANRSVLAAELAAELGLPSVGEAEVHGIAGVEPAPIALVQRLSVGDIALRRLRAPLLPRARLGADGLLGVDALKDRRVRLDFRENRLIVGSRRGFDLELGTTTSRARPEALDSEIVVPARFRFGQLIIIDADVGGRPVTCFLDSGSQNTVGNLALRRELEGVAPRFMAQREVVHLVSATGQTASGESAPLPGLRLGGLRIGNLSAVFADLHVFRIWDLLDAPAILLGVDVMRHFSSIDLDFSRKRVIFRTPRAKLQTIAEP